MAEPFVGFPRDMPSVLAELRDHNHRAWFEVHRKHYQGSVTMPLRALGAQLEPLLRSTDQRLEPSVSRVHRDLRFARDRWPCR